MRKIFIGFSKPKNKLFPIFSWAIRAFEQTKFSHVYVRHQTKYGIEIVYQASGTQVNFENGDVFLNKAEVVREFEFEISDEAFDRYMFFALKNVGKPYSVLQVFGIALFSLFDLKKNPFSNGSKYYVCSELVSEILYEIGRFRYDRNVFDKLTPKSLFEFCLKHSGEGAK